VQSMVQLLLGLDAPPSSYDASDALAVAICHVHRMNVPGNTVRTVRASRSTSRATSWRAFRLPR
jgi:Holliday junction resolvasome RuvABC endonuclease subunit